jgi:S1-C subfamily serine protease
LLKLETGGDSLPYLQIAGSNTLEVGDMVLAIGNPFGVGQTVTSGIVSALGRPVQGFAPDAPHPHGFIQTDAAINPGNSGGALVNMEGQMVGINAAIFSQSGGSHGIGFAVPAEVLIDLLKQMLEK